MPDHAPDNQPDDQPGDRPGGQLGPAGDPAGGVDIPWPRRPADDLPVIDRPVVDNAGDVLPDIGSVEPKWRYDQTWSRGKRRRYNGYVDRIDGAEGARLRENLAAAVRDLLDWAAHQAAQQHNKNADADGRGDRESGRGTARDSSKDGGPDDTPPDD